jgi:hypothetical protein
VTLGEALKLACLIEHVVETVMFHPVGEDVAGCGGECRGVG